MTLPPFWKADSTKKKLDLNPEGDAEGVRCYCNTAQCVSTGYMCRSRKGGGCYSEVPPRRHHARHGCLHHLAEKVTETDSSTSREAELAMLEAHSSENHTLDPNVHPTLGSQGDGIVTMQR
ncbi:jg9268 [Pararge aegeria aegeria]|uniref:Jg9268 protein n=1 Tax=Pararge aegeria aegeria TaxID=348720 RepID=A0A8S4SBW0_9NEOP|nr:jg9268 [Pararge aegeria aegeria]